MALRWWCAAGMVEAKKQFRRVHGFLHVPALRPAIDAYITTGDARRLQREGGGSSINGSGPPPKRRGIRDIFYSP